MSDFLKIFFVLCGFVTAFLFGRNYGEKTVVESKEYIKMRSDSSQAEKAEAELAGLKAKFQDLLDSSDLKKADEILSKIMTVFLADLSLHLSEDKEKDLSIGKAACVARPVADVSAPSQKSEPQAPQETTKLDIQQPQADKQAKNTGKYRSQEWILVNSQTDSEIRRNLKKLELKDLDIYLKGAPETNIQKSEKYLGSYRGRVFDVNQKEYGYLTLDLSPAKNSKGEDTLKGKIEFFRNNNSESTSNFTTDHFGYSPEGFSGTVVTLGGRQLQIYSIEGSRKLAGYFYERLPNGTTKTIGTFILNRTE
jgi:hypothetical protein